MPTKTTGSILRGRSATLAEELDSLCLPIDDEFMETAARTMDDLAKCMDADSVVDIACATNGDSVLFVWGEAVRAKPAAECIASGSATISREDCRRPEAVYSATAFALFEMTQAYILAGKI